MPEDIIYIVMATVCLLLIGVFGQIDLGIGFCLNMITPFRTRGIKIEDPQAMAFASIWHPR